MEEKEVRAVNIISIVLKHRWLLVRNFLIVAVVSAIISLLLPKWFSGRSVILPPPSMVSSIPSITSGSIGNILSGMADITGGEVGVYLAILDSRTLRIAAIDSFDLARVYKFKGKYYIENVLKVLDQRVSIDYIQEQGVISISVLDKSPKLAADLANFIVWKLDNINKELSVEKARRERIFLEERVKLNYQDIAQAESALKEFQEKHNAVAIPEQMEAAIKAAAEIKAEMISKQVEYEVMKRNITPGHPSLKELEQQISELKNKLNDFNLGSTDFGKGKGLFPGFSALPALQLEYAVLYREVEVQNNLLQFLLPQYEAAKIQEAKDTPTVQVLDRAVPAQKKTKPQRAKIVVLSCIFITILTTFYIFIKHHFEQIQAVEEEEYKSWLAIAEWLKKDLASIPWKKTLFRKK